MSNHDLLLISSSELRLVSNPELLLILSMLLQIEVLKMGWCKVGENEGAKAIADLILFNTSIATLDLRGNSLNNPGGPLLHTLQEASAASPVLSLTTQATILQSFRPCRKCLLLILCCIFQA